MNNKIAIILVNAPGYAEKFLFDCLKSLREQECMDKIKIFIVDNQTSPESAKLLYRQAPEAEIILNNKNRGFAGGNNDGIKLALQQGFDFIGLFNLDTIIDKKCVRHLVETLENNKNIGAVQSHYIYIHYACCADDQQRLPGAPSQPERPLCIDGTAIPYPAGIHYDCRSEFLIIQ